MSKLFVALSLILCLGMLGCGALDTKPSVSTASGSAITENGATLNGNLTDSGTASSVQVSFEWGTSSGSYSKETPVQATTSIGAFSSDITGLNPGMTYYFRAKAVGDGTGYGSEESFKTPEAPQLITKNASEMVLTLDDFEAGWTLSSSEDMTAATVGSQSAYKVTFQQMYTVVRNEVTVYSSIDAARTAYAEKVPTSVPVYHPSIGDECLLDVSKSPYVETLVFRENNVVVSVYANEGESESYARKVEAKIP